MDHKRMDIEEFRRLGLLQELNRLFLHPRGLALEVVVEEGQPTRFGGIWDSREDPEGIAFADDMLSPGMANSVQDMLIKRLAPRQKLFSNWDGIQPIPDNEPEDVNAAP